MLHLGLKFIQAPEYKSIFSASTHLIADIQATFDKYIWPKSKFLTKVQKNTLNNVLLDIINNIQSVQTLPPLPNFPQRLKNALKSLREDQDIIIAKADKGDTVVIMDSTQYYSLACKHLSDSSTYELLETDPSLQIVADYHHFLDRCLKDKVLDRIQYQRLLIPDDYRLPIMYFLPKIHKHPLKLRPIVASIKGITVNASCFLDRILQPHMRNTRSYCKNATHIVKLLQHKHVPATSYLASLDIESLYTNISFEMAIGTFLKIFASHPKLVLYLDLLKFVLRNNIFQFNGKIYHQICGIAMGTKLAPALASVVVAYYEEEYLDTVPYLPLVWKRYIDDILVIWPYSREEFDRFFIGLNCIHQKLKFTMEISYIAIQFLDLTIYKGPKFLRTGILSTSIFFKQTNTFSYLYGNSYIADYIFKGIAIGEVIRTLRNTSNCVYFKTVKRILIKKFYKRRFPLNAIKAAKRIMFWMRDDFLRLKNKRRILYPIPIRSKFHHFRPSVGAICRSSWARILDDPVLSHYFPTAPFPVWINHRNLKKILSYKQKTFINDQQTGELKKFLFQKFNRPTPRKSSNAV